MWLMKSIKAIYIFILIVALHWSCEQYTIEMQDEMMVFPIGRSWLGESEIKVFLDETEIHPEIIYDSCGGYWLQISDSDIPESGLIKIQFDRKKEELEFFEESQVNKQEWLSPSHYIDSDNETLRSKAIELTKDLKSGMEKAKRIQQFVINHITLNIYKDSFLEKASKTYELGYGTCMNFSRLYVALCRAAGIPARTIWGIIYGYNNDNIYDYHHQWAEVLDDSDAWHPADFGYTTYFDLNDIRYLDLIYAAEENTLIQSRENQTIILKELQYFNNYPVTLTGRLGFHLIEDKRPSSMKVEYSYRY